MPASHHPKNGNAPLADDRTVTLPIDGSTQRVRMCATRVGLPPILIVQAGPGFPLLREVPKFQRRLRLENDFLVCYWEQRGCGSASNLDAKSASLKRHVDDLRAVLQWVHNETKQKVMVFGISIGATYALQAVETRIGSDRGSNRHSADSDTARSDASIDAFLRQQAARANNRRLSAKIEKLGAPPYTTSSVFQQRAGLMADMGGVEHGRTFSSLLRETLFGMLRVYGPVGMVKAVRNMSTIQEATLAEMASLDLFADPPRLAVPIHYVFGEQDPIISGACEATPCGDCLAGADGDVRGERGAHGALRPSRVGTVCGDEGPRWRRVAPMTLSRRSSWMLYGAYGTTGRLIVDEALRRGHPPVLAGRDVDGAGEAIVRAGDDRRGGVLPREDGAIDHMRSLSCWFLVACCRCSALDCLRR